MPRLMITLLFSVLAWFGLASTLWCGADRSTANPDKAVVSSGESMKVLWTVLGYKRTDNATWTENEAKALLFKPLDMDSTSITFDQKKCTNVTFERKEVSASEYLKHHYNVTPQWLGIPDTNLRVIVTNCNIPGFAEYMRLKDRRLVIFLNGIFFFLEPNVTY